MQTQVMCQGIYPVRITIPHHLAVPYPMHFFYEHDTCGDATVKFEAIMNSLIG